MYDPSRDSMNQGLPYSQAPAASPYAPQQQQQQQQSNVPGMYPHQQQPNQPFVSQPYAAAQAASSMQHQHQQHGGYQQHPSTMMANLQQGGPAGPGHPYAMQQQQSQLQPPMMSAPQQQMMSVGGPFVGASQFHPLGAPNALPGVYPSPLPGAPFQQQKPSHQAPMDILGLADKAASAVQALAKQGGVAMTSPAMSAYASTVQQQHHHQQQHHQPPQGSGSAYQPFPRSSAAGPNMGGLPPPPPPPFSSSGPPYGMQQGGQQMPYGLQQFPPQGQSPPISGLQGTGYPVDDGSRRRGNKKSMQDLPVTVQYAVQVRP
jgi:hypothetical protein